jgi:2-succinyl-5-enolpyruvyl-6-hydroxy-3-cyclohexene-1-carboxylate synthase
MAAASSALEQGASGYVESFERVFGTPQGVRVDGLAHAAGLPYRQVTTADDLRDAVAAPPEGIELVEVRLDRTRRRELDEAVRGLGR